PIVDTEFTAELEDQLDEVEEGDMDWHTVLQEFYPPFETMLESAENAIEKVEIKDEPSDVICDKCGAQMVYRMGRFGKFLACPRFPECRNTKPILNYIEAKCPKCGGRLLEKTSRKNRKFYGCENYPECDFVSWEMPVNERCEKCGSYMTLKRSRKGEEWHLCSNETCRHRVEVTPAQTTEEDE
ncbi:MAG: topoisomerase DNA-binding C4 zinc finger domain-containing protein, partial [Eubacteriales bacterium]|nr:topoisomerase DNA-binding C4 zinc finger domain-containing protein [Eubacteriales bacterium]